MFWNAKNKLFWFFFFRHFFHNFAVSSFVTSVLRTIIFHKKQQHVKSQYFASNEKKTFQDCHSDVKFSLHMLMSAFIIWFALLYSFSQWNFITIFFAFFVFQRLLLISIGLALNAFRLMHLILFSPFRTTHSIS